MCPIQRCVLVVCLSLVPVGVSAQPVLYAGNGHYYEFVGTQSSWAGARTAADALTHLGVAGHLATVTSMEENDFLSSTFASGQPLFFAWIGGYEPNDDGVWLWGDGPENGTQFAQSATATAPYFYANWGGIEPNDFAFGEDFLAMNLGDSFVGVEPGKWIDSPNPNPSDPILGYLVEYETDPVGAIESAATGSVGATMSPARPNPSAGSCVVVLAAPAATEITLTVLDAAGRRIRTLVAGQAVAGTRDVSWDGRDASGRPVASGTYFLSLVSPGGACATERVVILR